MQERWRKENSFATEKWPAIWQGESIEGDEVQDYRAWRELADQWRGEKGRVVRKENNKGIIKEGK